MDEKSDEERDKFSYDGDNEGLKAEGATGRIVGSVKASKSTRSQAAIDSALFKLATQYVPPALLKRCTDATRNYQLLQAAQIVIIGR
jgi:hypothetical protein